MSVLTQQPAPAPMLEQDPPSSSGNRRTLLLVGGLVAALAAAAAAYFFLFSGSGTPAPTAVQPPAAAPKASASASTPAAGSTGTKRSSYPLTSRDPFAPLAGSGAKASTGTSSTTTSATAAGAPTPAAPIATPITFILASVDAKAGTASLSVDGTSYNATVGKVFGKSYMLYAVFNTSCAGVLIGDQSVPICVGHSVAVTP